MAVVGSEITVGDCDRPPHRFAGRVDDPEMLKVLLERNTRLIEPFRFGRCGCAMPRNPRQRHEPLAIGDAQKGAFDLGAVQPQQQIVPKPLDPRYLEAHDD